MTPVTYSGGSWNVETNNTVSISGGTTTDYNNYFNVWNDPNFQDINYAIIETESALISEVVVTG